MAISVVQSKKGTSTSATTNPSFDTAPTSGNVIVLGFASDDYNGTPDSGWTESAEMEQQTYHGGYLWWRISNGSNPPGGYTIGSATVSAWVLAEIAGCDATPYDISEGTFIQSDGTTMATPTIVPSTGDRILVAMVGASAGFNDVSGTYTSWSNSFTPLQSGGTIGGATDDCCGLAYRLVTGDGSTAFSTTATYPVLTQTRTGLIISFKAASAASGLLIRPSADDTDGGWTDSSAGTNLYAQLDETSASDADYIRSADSPSADTCKIHLGDPGVNVTAPVNLKVRYAKGGTGTINLTVKLFEGTTELWSKAYNGISASYVTAEELDITLNQPISDETDLYVSFIATAA